MASNTIATTEGQLSGVSGRFTLVVGRWNSFVVEHLLEGAIDTLKRHGISEDQLIREEMYEMNYNYIWLKKVTGENQIAFSRILMGCNDLPLFE